MESDGHNPSIAAQIASIREQVLRDGRSCVGCEELRLLCDGEVEPQRQLFVVVKIAAWEGWHFEMLEDGRVVFVQRRAESA